MITRSRKRVGSASAVSMLDALFFRLPKEWFILFLSDWLDIRSVAILDSAMTNHKYRPLFLQCLTEMVSKSVAANPDYCGCRVPCLLYLSRRLIQVKEISYLNVGGWCPVHVVDKLCFPSLESLMSRDIDDAGVLAIVKNSHALKSISLDGGKSHRDLFLTDAALDAIAQHCPLLEKLMMGRCPPGAHPFITSNALVNLFRSCRNLKSVDLQQYVLHGFDDADFARMQEFGALFTSFDIRFKPSVTAKAIADFAATCPNVTFATSLRWKECDKVLLKVAESMPLLKILQLYHDFSQSYSRTSDALLALARNCPLLEDITLFYCEYFNDTTLELLGTISSLKTLYIQGYDGLDELTYSAFASKFQNLRSLHLYGQGGRYCPSPAFFSTLTLAPSCLPCLEEILIFTDVPLQVDDVTVATALACLSNLQEIHIILAHRRLNDAALIVMASGCPKLKRLSLGCNPPLTIDLLTHLATTCTELNDITVWDEHNENEDDDDEVEDDSESNDEDDEDNEEDDDGNEDENGDDVDDVDDDEDEIDDEWGIPVDELYKFRERFPRIDLYRR